MRESNYSVGVNPLKVRSIVRNHDYRAAFSESLREDTEQQLMTRSIKSRTGFIQKQQLRFSAECPRKKYTPQLSA